MGLIRLAIGGGLAALALYFVYDLVSRYKTATGTTWQRILAAGHDSATMVWSKFLLVLAGIVANLDSLADLAGQPQVKEYIDLAVGNPKTVALIMLGISLVTMLARFRTL